MGDIQETSLRQFSKKMGCIVHILEHEKIIGVLDRTHLSPIACIRSWYIQLRLPILRTEINK
jgi:hypothetical protein